MATDIDEMDVGIATADTGAFRYAVVFDKRDLSREYFRGSLRGGAMSHVEKEAIPTAALEVLTGAMALEDSRD